MRPYVICHMLASIDGKVTGDFLFREGAECGTEVYYEINRALGEGARAAGKRYGFACGRVTMESSFTGGYYPDLTPYRGTEVPSGDFVARPEADFLAVAFDRRGRLGWQTGEIVDIDPGYGGAHIVEVLTEQARSEYLAYLRSIGVSYIIAGEFDTDIPLALEKLNSLFGTELLLLEGGAIINGALLRAGVIDEISLVTLPTVAGEGSAALFAEGGITDFYPVGASVHRGTCVTAYKRLGLAHRSHPEWVVRRLKERGWHISFAESCTGGLCAARLVSVPDASWVLDASHVTYANGAKISYLGVSEQSIAACGVVSEEVARQMAEGVAQRNGAEVGVGVSGIAGPGGGREKKPVGTVCFGFYINGDIISYTKHFGNIGRNEVREASADFVYKTLVELL